MNVLDNTLMIPKGDFHFISFKTSQSFSVVYRTQNTVHVRIHKAFFNQVSAQDQDLRDLRIIVPLELLQMSMQK